MKGLFLTFEELSDSSGISKKIVSQKKALEHNGIDIELAQIRENILGFKELTVDDKTIVNYKRGIFFKINYFIKYSNLYRYILEEKMDFLYIRYVHYATPFFVQFLKKMHKKKVRLILEIPTFPYDDEYQNLKFLSHIKVLIEKKCRKLMSKYLEKIVTVSDHDFIFGVQTIKISNGVDFASIKLKQNILYASNDIHLIGVASIKRWHGFDRLILGLSEFYKKEQELKVYFNIISGKGDEETLLFLKQLVKIKGLSEYVNFFGEVYGAKLDHLFDKSNIGVGSLGCHRIGISEIRILKNREYAARGIPFCYSGNDVDFDGKPYILKISADESTIDIEHIIKFYQNLSMSPEEIRESVKDSITWNVQMAKVANCILEKL